MDGKHRKKDDGLYDLINGDEDIDGDAELLQHLQPVLDTGLSPRSRECNLRVQRNMSKYMPSCSRTGMINDDKMLMCPECGVKNVSGLNWCLLCGLYLITAEPVNGCSMDFNCKLDLTGVNTDRGGRLVSGPELDIDLQEGPSPLAVLPASRGLHVPRLDLSAVAAEDCGPPARPARRWASSSQAWVDRPVHTLHKKPSSELLHPHRQPRHHPLAPRAVPDRSKTEPEVLPEVTYQIPLAANARARQRQSISFSSSSTSSRSPRSQDKLPTNQRPLSDIPVVRRRQFNSESVRPTVQTRHSYKETAPVVVDAVAAIQTQQEQIKSRLKHYGASTQQTPTQRQPVPALTEWRGSSQLSESATAFVPRLQQQQQEPEGSVSWHNLPTELWLRVMALLPLSSLCQLQCCNKRLHDVGQHRSLWDSISLSKTNTLNDPLLVAIARKRPRQLHFRNCVGTNITITGLRDMFKRCGERLERLSFISCGKGALENDQFLVLAAIFCPNVRHVNASYLMNLQNQTLNSMGEGFRHIVSLRLMGANSITNAALATLINRHADSMTHIDLYGCFKLNTGTLAILERCSNLRALALGSITKLRRSSMLSMLSKLSHLTELDLRGTMNLVDDALLLQMCRVCPRLSSLVLTNSMQLSSTGLQGLCASPVHLSLRLLDVCGCSHVDENGLRALAEHCTRLEDLDISCTGITVPRGSRVFQDHPPPSLRCLRINNNRLISEGDLDKIVQSCQKLRIVYLCGSSGISSWDSLKTRYPQIDFKHD